MDFNQKIKAALLGLAIGDALGVPVEFKSREWLSLNPITDMIGYGTYNQVPGTWSDDSSLTFCLVDSLCSGYDLKDIADKFIKWKDNAYWTAWNHVFDIGITTSNSINNLKNTDNPIDAGAKDEQSNGNGSLMRIIPLAFYTFTMNHNKRYKMVKDVASLTHAHIRSIIACFIYVEYAIKLINGEDKKFAYKKLQIDVSDFFLANYFHNNEIKQFDRIIKNDISKYSIDEIKSSGYVIHSLEAAFWCFLNTDSYKDAVLKAVNLGSDTDTIAAITGAVAGIYYGMDNIPNRWLIQLARNKDIETLAERFAKSV